MKSVKLTVKADTWFKEGTEVFDYDFDYSEKKRVTLDYWNNCLKDGNLICVRGIRVCEERIDGECCSCDEFDVEII